MPQANLGQNPKTDFEDYHIYPNPTMEGREGLKTLAASPNRAKVPVILTEYGAGSDRTLADTNELKAQLTYTLDIGPDAQASLTWNLAWKAADVSAREAGLKFLLPATTDRMSWFSDSVWTEYPAGHIDGPQGSATSKDSSFSSFRRDVHWMSLSGAGNYSVVALATGRLCTCAAASTTTASRCSSAAPSPPRPAAFPVATSA